MWNGGRPIARVMRRRDSLLVRRLPRGHLKAGLTAKVLLEVVQRDAHVVRLLLRRCRCSRLCLALGAAAQTYRCSRRLNDWFLVAANSADSVLNLLLDLVLLR